MNHNLIKNFFTITIVIVIWSFLWSVFAQSSEEFYYNNFDTDAPSTTIQRDILAEQVTSPADGILQKTLSLFGLSQYIANDRSALTYVEHIVNIMLWLTSFIAFVIILYGFWEIIFAKDDEGINKARKTVIGSAAAIAIIAVSRFIVIFIFDTYKAVSIGSSKWPIVWNSTSENTDPALPQKKKP